MSAATTMDPILWPLMDGPSVDADCCVVCGRMWPLNHHHVVRRSAGELYRGGRRLPKPTLVLCGMGNTSGCHRLAHENRLHFRLDGEGRWLWLLADEPVKYAEALELPGWAPLRYGQGGAR